MDIHVKKQEVSELIVQYVKNLEIVRGYVKMMVTLHAGMAHVQKLKKLALNFIVKMVILMIVLVMETAAQKLGLVMVLLIVPIKPMDAT